MQKAKNNEGEGSVGEGGEEEVTLRRREAFFAPSPYGFMRRSCTFVAESSLGLRKSVTRTSFTSQPSVRPSQKNTTAANKVVKDRKNLAMQVRQKKELLEESVEGTHDHSQASVNGSNGRMSRLVGGLRSWNSTEDVRQSFMGAMRPVTRRVKLAFGRPDPNKPENITSNRTSKSGLSKSNVTKAPANRLGVNKIETNKISTQQHNARNAPSKSQLKTVREKSPPGKTSKTKKTGKISSSKTQSVNTVAGRPKANPTSSNGELNDDSNTSGWFRHIQEVQEAYAARDGRNRRSHPQAALPDPDDQPSSSAEALGVDDGDIDGGDAADGSNDISADGKTSKNQDPTSKSEESSSTATSTPTTVQPPSSPDTLSKKTAEVGGASGSGSGPGGPSPSAGRSPASGRRLQEVQIIQIVEGPTLIQPSEVKVSQGVVLSAEPVLTPIEHLRRKDLKIRQALEEKQHIIADILNIPHEHFENVVDMAGEPAVGNKEPKELVLAAMFQAKCLQETLNEALNIGEADIVAARANNDSVNKASNLPLYQAPMTKLMSISTSLSQQLASLLNLISERDEERERMRKELVASRERLHLLHMRQNSNQPTASPASTTSGTTQPTATSPHTSRPSSFVSVASSTADNSDTPDHHDTDEESRNEPPKVNSLHPIECEDSKDDVVPETFEDAVSGEQTDVAADEVDGMSAAGGQECSEGSRENEGSTEATST